MRETKFEVALATFDEGYNCTQSVISAFAGDLGLDLSSALKLASCFGGGMRMGATCGALSGALMVLGLAKGFAEVSPEAKAEIEEEAKAFIASWKRELGVTDCREILGLDVSDPDQRQKAREQGVFELHCPQCIETAVRLLCDVLNY